MLKLKKMIPLLLVVVPLLPLQSLVAEEKAEAIDISGFACKDLMRLSGEDRSISLGVLHGYALGKKGVSSYVASELAEVSDQFIEYCLDNPNDKALAAFEKLAK